MEKIEKEGLPVRYSLLPPDRRRRIRDKYVRIQGGLCWFCGWDLNAPPPPEILNKPVDFSLYPIGFFNNPIHLQHDHNSDFTEGAVHCRCNAVLWEYHKR